ncbi:MAG: putative quinol monooxygenase [Methanobacterium sp.]
MQYVLVINKIEDYDKWRPIFDENMESRQNSGSKEAHVFRSADNPNEVVILYKWDNLDNAKKFFASSDVKTKMQKAGVVGMPNIHLLDGIGKTLA